MPAATSPKKKSLMPAGKLRRSLRGHGHHLQPLVQIGKAGVTDALLRQVTQALADHELVKVRVGTEAPESRFEAAERLAELPGAQIAQILGRTVLIYKRHPKHPKFEGSRAQLARGASDKGGRG